MTSGWGDGYITDIAYIPGYYRYQSPLHLNLACLLAGVKGIAVEPASPLSYLELGCGQGFGAAALAAANPQWRVTAIDFNPAHIAAARELAKAAGLDNIEYIEADLATLAGTAAAADIPAADVATLHGLWSWVGDEVRNGVARLLGDKVKAGGIALVSYNALPAWQGAIGMQRVLREAGVRSAGRSDRQIAAGIELIRELRKADAHNLRQAEFIAPLIDQPDRVRTAYLAHEFMNATWRPCFHADVVAAFGAVKFDWVGSAHLLEHFSPLMLNETARALAARFDDPIMRELIKDMCLERSLRQDVFVRGARDIGVAERDTELSEVMLALLCPAEHFSWEVDVPTGKATIERAFFGPIVSALAEGPRRVGDLLALPDLPRRDNPAELVGMLVGTGQAMPVLAPAEPPRAEARRLNRAAAARFVDPHNLSSPIALASSGTGAPIPCQMLDLLIVARLQADAAADPASWAAKLAIGFPDSERDRLREHIERRIAEAVPLWRRLGALGPAHAP